MAGKVLPSAKKATLLAVLPTIKFVNDVEVKAYRCGVCSNVAVYHYLTTCKHLFCGKCHGIYANKACPISNCSNSSIDKVSQIMDIELGVNNLKAHCIYSNNGCEEILALSGILDHKARCKFSTHNLLPKLWTPPANGKVLDKLVIEFHELKAVVETLQHQKNKCNCQSLENSIRREIHGQYSILKQQMQESENKLTKKINDLKLNSESTLMCNLSEECKKLSSEYEEKLSKVRDNLLVDVSLNIAQKLERQMQALEKKFVKEMSDQKLDIELNLKSSLTEECGKIKSDIKKNSENLKKKFATVQTENSKVPQELERNYKLISSEVDTINMKNDDVDIYVSKMNMEILERNITILSHHLVNENSPEFTWTIRGIEGKLNDLKTGSLEKLTSGILIAKDYDAKIVATLRMEPGEKSFGLQYNVVDWNKSLLSKNYEFHQARVCLLDKSDLKGKNVWRVIDFDFSGSPEQTLGFENIAPSKFLVKGSPYIKDDSIDIKLLLVPYSLSHKFFQSNNGILIWKLHNYTQLKQDGIDGVSYDIQSEEFYTVKRGYRMQMLLSFEETYMSICELCIKGEYDNFLSFNFPHTNEIVIFDQSGAKEKSHLSKTVESDVTWPCEIFQFSYDELESPRYLKNDCLLIKITVEHTS